MFTGIIEALGRVSRVEAQGEKTRLAIEAPDVTDGLPIGVQVVGRPFEEVLVLAVAAAIEAGCGGYRPPPITRSFRTAPPLCRTSG